MKKVQNVVTKSTITKKKITKINIHIYIYNNIFFKLGGPSPPPPPPPPGSPKSISGSVHALRHGQFAVTNMAKAMMIKVQDSCQ